MGTVPRANVAGTGRSTFKDGATQIAAGTTGTVLSLNVPAGSYLFIAKGVLAKVVTQITCTTTAATDTDTSLHRRGREQHDREHRRAHVRLGGHGDVRVQQPRGQPAVRHEREAHGDPVRGTAERGGAVAPSVGLGSATIPAGG